MPNKIAIFDGDKEILELCTLLLETRDWLVFTYTSCKDFITKVKQSLPDIILLDDTLCTEQEMQFVAQLKDDRDLKGLPLVLFTTKPEGTPIEKGNIDGVLRKPFDIYEIGRELLDFLKRKK